MICSTVVSNAFYKKERPPKKVYPCPNFTESDSSEEEEFDDTEADITGREHAGDKGSRSDKKKPLTRGRSKNDGVRDKGSGSAGPRDNGRSGKSKGDREVGEGGVSGRGRGRGRSPTSPVVCDSSFESDDGQDEIDSRSSDVCTRGDNDYSSDGSNSSHVSRRSHNSSSSHGSGCLDNGEVSEEDVLLSRLHRTPARNKLLHRQENKGQGGGRSNRGITTPSSRERQYGGVIREGGRKTTVTTPWSSSSKKRKSSIKSRASDDTINTDTGRDRKDARRCGTSNGISRVDADRGGHATTVHSASGTATAGDRRKARKIVSAPTDEAGWIKGAGSSTTSPLLAFRGPQAAERKNTERKLRQSKMGSFLVRSATRNDRGGDSSDEVEEILT